jgi:hypothetical protein
VFQNKTAPIFEGAVLLIFVKFRDAFCEKEAIFGKFLSIIG